MISRLIFEGVFKNRGLEFCWSTYGFPEKSLNGNIRSTLEVSELEVESGILIFWDNTTTEFSSSKATKPGIRNFSVAMYKLSLFKVFCFYRFYKLRRP